MYVLSLNYVIQVVFFENADYELTNPKNLLILKTFYITILFSGTVQLCFKSGGIKANTLLRYHTAPEGSEIRSTSE